MYCITVEYQILMTTPMLGALSKWYRITNGFPGYKPKNNFSHDLNEPQNNKSIF